MQLSNRLIRSLLSRVLLHQNYELLNEQTLYSNSISHSFGILLTDVPLDFWPNHLRVILLVDATNLAGIRPGNNLMGLLCQDSDEEEIIRCLQVVATGGQFYSLSLISQLQNPSPASTPPPDGLGNLSRREREIFLLFQKGKTGRQIAEQLFISEFTAENHLAKIREKLGLKGKNSLVRFAAQFARTA